MRNVGELVNVVFSGLSPLVVDDVADEDERIQVRARTPDRPVTCSECGAEATRVHDYHERTVADVAVGARHVLVVMRIRRLVCPTRGRRQTFRERLPGVLERYQRRTPRLACQIGAVVRELAGRAGTRVLSAPAVRLSRHARRRSPTPAAFIRGLDQDRDAVRAAVTSPFHNGGAEGVNTKTKRIMRQMHGRAGFALLRHRVLLT